MNGILILIVAVIYFLTGINMFFNKHYAMGIVFLSYGVSNVALYMVNL